MKNQKGQASAEFLFSLVVAFGLFILFFSISFTLSIVEVGQYIAFSVSRAHAAGNTDQVAQMKAATDKYNNLQAVPAFKFLFQSGWFVFGTPKIAQGLNSTSGTQTFRAKLGDGSSGSGMQFEQSFTGVSIPFVSKIMAMQVPFLNPATDDMTFSTNINAVLIREPSAKECMDFWNARQSALQTLPSGQSFYKSSSYISMEDSGC